jgi:hypothetical protein
MPGSSTTPGRSDLAMVCPKRVAFRARNSVGTRGLAFAAQWLAYALPYRRFVGVLTDANARLGADVDRYSFIVVDLHHLLLAGLPAHFESYMASHAVGSLWRANQIDCSQDVVGRALLHVVVVSGALPEFEVPESWIEPTAGW